MKVLYPKKPPLALGAQAAGLRAMFPNGQTMLASGTVTWLGDLSPDQYGRTYHVHMQYRQDEAPRVWVRAPDLHVLANGRRLPHVYEQKTQRLCLYVPGCGFWTPDCSLNRTILPWTCYWLRLFEMWLVTDVWHERGVHPEARPPKHKSSGVLL